MWERNTDQLLLANTLTDCGPNPQFWHVPRPVIEPATFCFVGWPTEPHWSGLSLSLLSIVSSFLSTSPFSSASRHTIAWAILQIKQATKHMSFLIVTLLLPRHFSVPYHCQISCVVHLNCLYSPIHSSLLNYDLGSNTIGLLIFLVRSI